MNRIRTGRLMFAGLVTLLVFILVEIVWESLIGGTLLPRIVAAYEATYNLESWSWANHLINIGVAAVISVMMIWLYAALRPMFGVGPRTALITSGFVFAFVFAFTVNTVNLRFYPMSAAVVDVVNLVIELPISIIAGAAFYEAG